MERKIQRLFGRACAGYSLLEDGDRVLVALSGGKDSLELVRLMGRQQRILKPRIEVEAVHVIMDDIPYETDRTYIQRFCEEQGVRLTVLHSRSLSPSPSPVGRGEMPQDTSPNADTAMPQEASSNADAAISQEASPDAGSALLQGTSPNAGSTLNSKSTKPKCFLCSWNRRKAIFRYATEQGFNKVALGHHQDDILTTLLMNMTFEGSIQTMPPRLRLKHYPIEVIRPLCLVPEWMIKEVAQSLGFEKQKALCPFDRVTRRKDINDVFHLLERLNPEARYSLWNSMKNIHPDLLP